MRVRRVFSLIPALTLWLMLCALVWGFVFTRITDAPAKDKIVIFIDEEDPDTDAVRARVEAALHDQIRLVLVRPFSYAMFGGDELMSADLFIVPASDVESFCDWFAPIPESMRDAGEALYVGDVPLALRVGEAGVRLFGGSDRIAYYLAFGARSIHNAELDGAVDDLAALAARSILTDE